MAKHMGSKKKSRIVTRAVHNGWLEVKWVPQGFFTRARAKVHISPQGLIYVQKPILPIDVDAMIEVLRKSVVLGSGRYVSE